MRYWQHNETGRLIKVNVKMAPRNWTELTKEQYEEALTNYGDYGIMDIMPVCETGDEQFNSA